ncbi:MAG: TlpA family protein disulfide reductase [Chloroflexi bacterium]|nr:TlpA family protein disulfide reductase [Chloroflexota bacterium]
MSKITLSVVVGALVLSVVFGYAFTQRGSAGSADPAAVRVGRQASDFSIKLFSGEEFRLSDQRGKAVAVNFWASWCPPCREEAPVLERAWQAYKDRGAVLVGVDIWDNESDARAFMKEFGITYPNGLDATGEIAIEYGVTGLPETWFIDRDGKLVRRWIGPLTDYQVSAFFEEALR